MADEATQREIEERLGRPFSTVKAQLIDLFGRDWDEIEVVVETAASKGGRSPSDVIVDLVARSEAKPSPQQRLKRSVIRWIGKPWRDRTNPWDRFKDRLPPIPPRIGDKADDLDEWTPLRPEQE